MYLYLLCFVLFLLSIIILIFFICTNVRTAVTEWELNCSSSSSSSSSSSNFEGLSTHRTGTSELQKRPTGRPKARWKDEVENDVRKLGIVNWTQVARRIGMYGDEQPLRG